MFISVCLITLASQKHAAVASSYRDLKFYSKDHKQHKGLMQRKYNYIVE